MQKKLADFVRVTEVKDTVSSLLFPLISKMKQRETEYNWIKNQFTIMSADLQKHRIESRQTLRLKSDINNCIRDIRNL